MKVILSLLVSILCCCACSESCDLDSSCGLIPEIDPVIFESNIAHPTGFSSVSLVDDCLTLRVSNVGCDGSTWEVRLIDNGVITYEGIPKRKLKFMLDSSEPCLDLVSREFSFDLCPLRIEDEVCLFIDLVGYHRVLGYHY